MVAKVRGQERPDVLEHGVAGGVAVAIVRLLEAVEVEHHHREPPLGSGPLRSAELLVEALLEETTVPEPGERIPVGHRTVDV